MTNGTKNNVLKALIFLCNEILKLNFKIKLLHNEIKMPKQALTPQEVRNIISALK